MPGSYDILYARLLGGAVVPANALALVDADVEIAADDSIDIA